MRGGGRMGGGLSGGSGRIGGGLTGGSGRMGGGARPPVSRPAPRAVQPRGRGGGFGTGMATGMLLGGGMRRRMWGPRWGWGGGWGGRTVVHHHHGGGGGPAGPGGRPGGGCGCFTVILAVFVLIIVLALVGQIFNVGAPGGGGQVTRSTIQREALGRGEADSRVPLIVAPNARIGNRTAVERSLQNFHNRTGVRPILYITDSINGIQPWDLDDDTLSDFARERYVELTGTNQAHVLLLFLVNDQEEYNMWVQPGSATHTVMDGEAIDILMDNVQRFWTMDRDKSLMFSRAFDQAGTSIMQVHRSPWVNVMIVAGVLLILFLLYTWWKAKQDQKNLEAEQTERILNQDLNEFGAGDDEASRLAQQYEDNNEQ